MKIIKKHYTIKSELSHVWKGLVEPSSIKAWGAGPAVMDGKVGTQFSLWGGDIHGKNIEVLKEKKLVQEWFAGEWTEPSIATFVLAKKNGEVTLELIHENVPESEASEIDSGWDDYYLGPLKAFVEGRK